MAIGFNCVMPQHFVDLRSDEARLAREILEGKSPEEVRTAREKLLAVQVALRTYLHQEVLEMDAKIEGTRDALEDHG